MSEAWFGLYESFAARPFGGNVAGVVIAPEELRESHMAGLAADIGAPTTGFVSLSSVTGRTVSVRYFTPTHEIAACGHVAIAVAKALHERAVLSAGDPVTLRSLAGSLDVSSAGDLLTVAQQPRAVADPVSTIAEVASALGVAVESLATGATGLRHLFVRLAEPDLARLEVSHEQMRRLGETNDVDTIGVYATRGADRVRLRDFTAPIGVLEEPASGTTAGALGLLLGRPALTVEQGFEMGRPSELQFVNESGHALVSGTARRVIAGRIEPGLLLALEVD